MRHRLGILSTALVILAAEGARAQAQSFVASGAVANATTDAGAPVSGSALELAGASAAEASARLAPEPGDRHKGKRARRRAKARADKRAAADGPLDFPGVEARLRRGTITVVDAFDSAVRLSSFGDRAATEWCLTHFDEVRRERGLVTRAGDLPYGAAEASTKIALYGRWIEDWPGHFGKRSFDIIAALDRESRALEPTLGRTTALGLFEALEERARATRARANVLMGHASVLARGDAGEVELARSIYRRIEREYAGTPAAKQAARALWRSVHLGMGRVTPDFETRDFAGNEIRLSDFQGQVVVVHFWQQSGSQDWEDRYLEELRELARRFWDTPFALIAVKGDTDVDQHRLRWVEHGVVWHEAFEPSPKTGARARWRIDEWPSTYVLDEERRVRAIGLSPSELEEFLNPMVSRLAEEAISAAETSEATDTDGPNQN